MGVSVFQHAKKVLRPSFLKKYPGVLPEGKIAFRFHALGDAGDDRTGGVNGEMLRGECTIFSVYHF